MSRAKNIELLGAGYFDKDLSLTLASPDKQSYSKDFLDLNVGGGYCLFDAREHRALFHSILYLVALDFNLRRGFSDAFGCLYHSSEAFRLINERIQSANFEDATIAAVALIGAKEVCSCRLFNIGIVVLNLSYAEPRWHV